MLKAVTVSKEGTETKPVPVLLTFYRGDDKTEFEKGWDEAIKHVS